MPGGLIWEDKNIVDWIGDIPYVQAFEFEILFWKSPAITGSVKFNLGLGADCAPPSAERQAEAEALARSECERLAKLVHDRLPGEEPSDDYAKIISVLRKYKEVDFQSFSDEILRKALKDKETSDTGKGITENLRVMVQEIDDFNEALKHPLTSQDDQNAPLVRTPNVNWLKLLKRFIEALAPSSLPLDKIRKIKELLDEIGKAGVNAIEIPHGAKEMYNGYRNARDGGADLDGAYAESGTANYFEVRKADEFKDMGPTQVDIELMKRFEERYKLEKAAEELEKERQKILADPDRYINVNFVNKYQDKIDVLYRKCEELIQQNSSNGTGNK